MFGIPDSALPSIFPNLVNFPTPKLAFLGRAATVRNPEPEDSRWFSF